MERDDAQRFESAMIALAAVTGKELDSVIKSAYFMALKDVPIDTVVGAMRSALTSEEWFPSAARLRVICDSVEFTLKQEALPAPQSHGHDRPEPVYACPECRDGGFTFYTHKGVRWAKRCLCRVPDADGKISNVVIAERIRRAREATGNPGTYAARGRRRHGLQGVGKFRPGQDREYYND